MAATVAYQADYDIMDVSEGRFDDDYFKFRAAIKDLLG